jgi:RND family efflux transporter MFP subunit
MNKNIARIAAATGVLGIIGFGAMTLLGNKQQVEQKIYKPSTDLKALVQVDTVRDSRLHSDMQLLGTFQPNREVDVISEANGKVVAVGAKKGDVVAAGTLIARLDNEILQAQLTTAQAQLDKAKLDVQRMETIVAQDAMPKNQLEQTRLGLKSAEAQVTMLKKQIANTSIYAPFGGVMTARMFEQGSVVQPGVPLAKIMDISALKLTVNVPETDVVNLAKGQTLVVRTDLYPDEEFRGIITTIGARGDAAHNYEVEITVNNSPSNSPSNSQANSQQKPLKAGMYGTTSISQQRATSGIVIPRLALVGSAKNPQVYVVESGVAKLRNLTVQPTSANELLVTAGLQKGDIIVVGGQINLSDGAAVSVAR